MRTGGSMLASVGHTPVVKLSEVVPDGAAEVYIKLEWFNPTGSYKDRMALAMIEEAEHRGDLRPGMTVVEHGRQHRFVPGVRLRREGVPVPRRVLGRVRRGETPDDDGVRS